MTSGRYEDPLNPWGDIMAVAEAWCVTTDQAKLAIGAIYGTLLNYNVQY